MARHLKPLIPYGARRIDEHQLSSLATFLEHGRVLVLSGAGLSTSSGLRDYRSPGRELRRTPMHAAEFANSADARRRYWSRSFFGYRHLRHAQPNEAHGSLALLHNNVPRFASHITQNVDGLLQRAGAHPPTLIELHGTVTRTVCGDCHATEKRDDFQLRLEDANPSLATFDVPLRPDGDAEVPEGTVVAFNVPRCASCGSDKLSPAVVFHGGAVPPHVTHRARMAVDEADVVWVIGSTLTTYSAFSLVKRAKENGAKTVAVNFGKTRADELLDFKCETLVEDTVQRVANILLQQHIADSNATVPHVV